MKLHLGCGERYLEDYVNIDFPAAQHTVLDTSKVDRYADILALRYPSVTVEEVRLHHVFEHFPRPVACALLASWHSWLATEGLLRIEVPDFARTARVMLKRFASQKQRAVAERHIFGSHEAEWAVHFGGYTSKALSAFVGAYGFRVVEVRRNSWRGTYNIEVFARKDTAQLTVEDFSRITRQHLAHSLVDDSESERRLLGVWMERYHRQAEACYAVE